MCLQLAAEDARTGMLGKGRADFARLYFALDAPLQGNARRLFWLASQKCNTSPHNLYRWREDALFIAAIEAAKRGLL